MFRLIVAICFFASTLAQNDEMEILNPCPDVPRAAEFDFTALEGMWYVAGKFTTESQRLNPCSWHKYSYEKRGLPQVEMGSISDGRPPYKAGEPFKNVFPVTLNDAKPAELVLHDHVPKDVIVVLFDDVEGYAILHSCYKSSVNEMIMMKQSTTILLRSKPSGDFDMSVYKVIIRQLDIDVSYNSLSDHTNCTNYPIKPRILADANASDQ